MSVAAAVARRTLGLRSLWGSDLAVDLGSSAFRVGSAGSQQIDELPARRNGARAMRGGVIADPACASDILRELFRRSRRGGLFRPRVVASLPSDVSDEERARLLAVLRAAGAAEVATFPEPLAAAVGSGLDVGSPYAQMIVDVGCGVTDGLVVREGKVLVSAAVRVGCGDLERAVVAHVAMLGGRIDEAAALELLGELRFDREPSGEGSVRVQAAEGPIEVDLAAVSALVESWRDAVLAIPRRLSRELDHQAGAELVESGLWVSGGGALLPGLVPAIGAATGLEARRVRAPLTAVVEGNRSLLATVAHLDAWR